MKKFLSILMVLTMLVAALSMFAVPTSAEENPYVTDYDSKTEFTISNETEYLQFYDAMVNQGKNFKGKKVKLTASLSLNDTSNETWYESPDVTPLFETKASGAGFLGEFDGQGNTVKGIYIKAMGMNDVGSVGIFSAVTELTAIKNFYVEDFYICNTFKRSGGGYLNGTYMNNGTGGLIGHAYRGVNIDRCSLKNGIITTVAYEGDIAGDGGIKMAAVGAVVGTIQIGPDATEMSKMDINITNTTVENVTLSLGADMPDTVGKIGGIIGWNYFKMSPGKNLVTYDFSGSKFVPNDAADIEPFGHFYKSQWEESNIIIKNDVHSKNVTVDFPAIDSESGDNPDVSRPPIVNAALRKIKVYGADYLPAGNYYTVEWVVGEQTITDDNVAENTKPSFVGSTDKAMDEDWIYEFKGWKVGDTDTVLGDDELPAATADAKYTAVYDKFKRINVIWNVNGTKTPDVYKEGEIPKFKGDTRKAEDDKCVYTFSGWSPNVGALTEDVEFVAQYTSKTKYTVTWVVDGTETKEVWLEGLMPRFNGKTEKAEDAENTYEFTGWDKEISSVTGDVVYTAQFKATPKNAAANADTTAPAAEEGGCGSMISLGMVTVLAVGAAGAVVLRKKED